jgi:hypothetical protein
MYLDREKQVSVKRAVGGIMWRLSEHSCSVTCMKIWGYGEVRLRMCACAQYASAGADSNIIGFISSSAFSWLFLHGIAILLHHGFYDSGAYQCRVHLFFKLSTFYQRSTDSQTPKRSFVCEDLFIRLLAEDDSKLTDLSKNTPWENLTGTISSPIWSF